METRKSTAETVAELLATTVGADPARVRPDARLVEYGLDSARAVDLVIALEEAFGIEIPDADAARLKTLRELVGYVERRLQPGS